jgi:hypothetical protein
MMIVFTKASLPPENAWDVSRKAHGLPLPLLDNTRSATSAKAQRMLGWKPRPREEAVVASAESLIRFGIVSRHGQ